VSGENWTPGPWQVNPQDHRFVEVDGGRAIASAYGRDSEALGNGLLIAAAPTMADYIKRRASDGCEEAAKIWETINAR
jgi:hypothetical protein